MSDDIVERLRGLDEQNQHLDCQAAAEIEQLRVDLNEALIDSESLRAQLEWQDISTAPKDGTVVRIWAECYGDYGYTTDEWRQMDAQQVQGKWRPSQATGRYWSGFNPTHWHPLLPEPTP